MSAQPSIVHAMPRQAFGCGGRPATAQSTTTDLANADVAVSSSADSRVMSGPVLPRPHFAGPAKHLVVCIVAMQALISHRAPLQPKYRLTDDQETALAELASNLAHMTPEQVQRCGSGGIISQACRLASATAHAWCDTCGRGIGTPRPR